MSNQNNSFLPSVFWEMENGSGDVDGGYEADFLSDDDDYAVMGKKRFRWSEKREDSVSLEEIDKRLNVHLEEMEENRRKPISKPILKRPSRPKRFKPISARLTAASPAPQRTSERFTTGKMPSVHHNMHQPSTTKSMTPVPPTPQQESYRRCFPQGRLRPVEVGRPYRPTPVPPPPCEVAPKDLPVQKPQFVPQLQLEDDKRHRHPQGRLRPVEVGRPYRPTPVSQPPCEVAPRDLPVRRPPFVPRLQLGDNSSNSGSPLVPITPMAPRQHSCKRRLPQGRLRPLEVTGDLNLNNNFTSCQKKLAPIPPIARWPLCNIANIPSSHALPRPPMTPQAGNRPNTKTEAKDLKSRESPNH